MAILGVDFGERYLGLALSQGELGEPLGVIYNTKDVFVKIKDLVKRHDVEKVVLGLPEGVLKDKAISFGGELSKRLELPIFYVSEVYTSREAQDKLIAAKTTKKKRHQRVHAAAAALILEAFLAGNK